MLSDSPRLVEWLVRLAFSYCSLPDGQAPLVPLFWWILLSFYTKKCVAESSWEKMITLWGQNNVLRRILFVPVNNIMTFSAYISNWNIFFKMTIFTDWQCAVWDNQSNRPFPSALVPLFQSKSKCKTIYLKMSSACSIIFIKINVIFIRMVSHLDSLWNRGTSELGNGLLCQCFFPPRYTNERP